MGGSVRTVRVLIVDDTPVYQRLLEQIVLTAVPAAEVLAVGSALEAIGAVEEQQFDIALVDLVLPMGPSGGATGPQVGMELLQELVGAVGTVVVVSGIDAERDCLTAGAAAFFSKGDPGMTRKLRQFLRAAASQLVSAQAAGARGGGGCAPA